MLETKNAGANDECLICSFSLKQRRFYAVIPCSCSDITVCAICAMRLRYFEKKRTCPFCKAPWKTLLFTPKKYDRSFKQIDMSKKVFDVSIDVFFEDESDLYFFKNLRSFHCIICKRWDNKSTDFKSLLELAKHLKYEHKKYFCEICAGNEKVFPYEFDLFNATELRKHKKDGYTKSKNKLNIEPHPQCKFCKVFCFDLDALYIHLERRHVMCQFCRARGKHVYEADIEGMREHFRKMHFLCEAPECLKQNFVAFDNGIDLNDHYIHFHGKQLSLSEIENKRNITKYSNFGNTLLNTPTQFTINRQNTRDAFSPSAPVSAPTLATASYSNSISFPALPATRGALGRRNNGASALSFSRPVPRSFSDQVANRAQHIDHPPLPPLKNNRLGQNGKKASIVRRKAPMSQAELEARKNDRLLDKIISEAKKEKSRKPSTKTEPSHGRRKCDEKGLGIFREGMPQPTPFDYEDLPMRHANLHKRLKRLGGHLKFEKFSKLYFKFTTENFPAAKFCDDFIAVFGVSDHSLVSLYEIVRLVSNDEKSRALFAVCQKTDFCGLQKKQKESSKKS